MKTMPYSMTMPVFNQTIAVSVLIFPGSLLSSELYRLSSVVCKGERPEPQSMRLVFGCRLRQVSSYESSGVKSDGSLFQRLGKFHAPPNCEEARTDNAIVTAPNMTKMGRILEHLGGDGDPVDPGHPSRAPPQGDLLV